MTHILLRKIKKLVWRQGYRDEIVNITQATTVGGIFQIRVLKEAIWLDTPDRKASADFRTIEAAQIEHERRVGECFDDGSMTR